MNALDRSKAALTAFIALLTSRYDYALTYPCTVVAQNADGTLELRPDSASVPGLSKVPIAYGIPGVRATVKAGARVRLTFEDLDPSRPIATIFETAGVVQLVLDTDAAAPRPVARMGDVLNVIALPAMPITGTITGPSGPVPFTGTLLMPQPAVGIVTTGSPRVLA